jgi:Uma2 family endonuclease
MTQAIYKMAAETHAEPQIVTFEEFVQWKPEGNLYELHDGVIVTMSQPSGKHEDITSFLAEKVMVEYLRLGLPYRIPKTVLIRSLGQFSAYSPDVLVLNRPNLVNELLWEKASTVTQGESIPLVIEVVSSNWRADYLMKVKDYEEIGINEYWIVDYLGLGGRRFIGDPKQPTILIHHLIEGEFQISNFQGNDRIVSPTFPELSLTANQIFEAEIGA